MKKLILFSFALVLTISAIDSASAQNQQTTVSNTDPKTGVRVTTIVKPLPTLSEQVADFEKKLAEAENDPQMQANGTVAKYRLVLDRLRKDLETENAERRRIEATENK